MSALTLGAVIAGLALVTLATRSFFLVLGDRVALPERIRHALRYAPMCALAALIVPQLVLTERGLAITPLNARLDAGLVAIAVMLFSRSMLGAMSAGLAAFLLLRALL